MGAIAMAVSIVLAFAVFGWSAQRRLRLLEVGGAENRFNELGKRLWHTITVAFFQKKMPKYKVMGPIHIVIFWGFLILLINTLMLWGRAFDETFHLWILGDNWFGQAYFFVKDVVAVAVLAAAFLALLNRVVLRPARMTQSFEAALILAIIVVMMVADLMYWGWQLSLEGITGFHLDEPFASTVAGLYASLDFAPDTVALLGTIGYWTHSLLVLIFLNILPYGKHFHVITAIPNVFFDDLTPRGRLPRDENIEKVLREEDEEDDEEEPVFGVNKIQDFTWKDILDMYTCTECGRCTDNCPAAKTDKPLRPKTNLCEMRDHLYDRQAEFLSGKAESKELVPDVVDPEVVWSCTTCRACEEECPVSIKYVDKFVRLRRDLVEARGEPPAELATALRGMETNSNPWNISAMDRDKWMEGLDVEVPEFDPEEHEYLLYLGCMYSFDDRAQKISRSLVKLLDKAGVSYGYLGSDEPCCGETARRGGSESSFRMMADMNVETFNELGVKKIITGCPHCFNTLTNEYPEFGGNWEVVHHSKLLADLVAGGKLRPEHRIDHSVVYHDGCYLGRYNDIYAPPRRILEAIPGVELREIKQTKKRGMCCGAGGARFFMEETGERVNRLRTDQILEADPRSIASACPYCMTMLSDALKDKDLYDGKGQLDVAEMLSIACGLDDRKLLHEEEPEPEEIAN